LKTVFILSAFTDRAVKWIGENVRYEGWQKVGDGGIAVEHRYIEPIVEAMIEDGLVREKDFTVW
jgi:hypothetical protein